MSEKKTVSELQSLYKTACDKYLETFAKRHDFSIRECRWVADEPGGVAEVGDYMVDMQTIIDDVNMNADSFAFFAWYEYTMECHELGLPDVCNFRSWLRGCPRYSRERLEYLRELKQQVYMAECAFMDAVKKCVTDSKM